VERALADRHRRILVAMATGTGKTFTLVNQVYRLMKADVAKRVLFLVDRRALAAQAVRAFASFDADTRAEVRQDIRALLQPFQTDDFGDDEPFDPKVRPNSYLTDRLFLEPLQRCQEGGI
jgi:type I restriction enzyme R subunit